MTNKQNLFNMDSSKLNTDALKQENLQEIQFQPMHTPDPVHYAEGPNEWEKEQNIEVKPGWYFWEETWADRNGPYESEEKCRAEFCRYLREVFGE